MSKRHSNTATQMKHDGSWVKVAKKHYRHVSGEEVRYDCNRWHWVTTVADRNGRTQFSALWEAKFGIEQATNGGW